MRHGDLLAWAFAVGAVGCGGDAPPAPALPAVEGGTTGARADAGREGADEDRGPGAGEGAPLAVEDASVSTMEDARVGADDSEEDPAAASDASASATTYTEHVRPILTEACLSCHTEGGIAPLRLDDYESAKTFAPLIASAVRSRRMPPTSIDASGACNTFRDLPWLTEAQIETLEHWAQEGTPQGDPALPAPEPPSVPGLSGTVVSMATPEYVPSTEDPDDYRCFVMDSPFTENTFVTGFDVRPGDLETAHHAVIFYPLDDLFAESARVLDLLEDGPGYSCFGSPVVPATILGAWVPGAGAILYPDDLGIEVAAGRPLIIQMHYNTLATPNPGVDVTRLELQTKTEGVVPAAFANLLDLEMRAEPGVPDAEVTFQGLPALTSGTAPEALQIHAVLPHMHELGRKFALRRSGMAGTDGCLVDVPRYEFAWQRLYVFDDPIQLEPGEQLDVRCEYDTTSRTEPVTWGDGTQDEMCVAGLLVKL